MHDPSPTRTQPSLFQRHTGKTLEPLRFVHSVQNATMHGFAGNKIIITSNFRSQSSFSQAAQEHSTDTPTKLRMILMSSHRSDQDAEFLYNHLKDLKFFKEFNLMNENLNEAESLLHLCKHFGYERFDAGKVVFQEGDESNGKMYIIYKGEVSIVKKQIDDFMAKNLQNIALTDELATPTSITPIKKDKSDITRVSDTKLFLTEDSECPTPVDKGKLYWNILRPVIGATASRRNSVKGSPINSHSRRSSIIQSPRTPRRGSFFVAETETLDTIISKYGKIIDKIGKGGFFGERALASKVNRSATIVTNTECEFLTVSAELFAFIKARFERSNTLKLNFMLDFFPNLDQVTNKKMIEALIYLLEERTFNLNNSIITEGTKSKEFFILFEGHCDVYKEAIIEKPPSNPHIPLAKTKTKESVKLCTLFPGVFFGDEILFNSTSQYEYTVKAASSKVVVLALDKVKFNVRFPQAVFDGLYNLYQKRKQQHMYLLNKILTQKMRQHPEYHSIPNNLNNKKFKNPDHKIAKVLKSKVEILRRASVVPAVNKEDVDAIRSSPQKYHHLRLTADLFKDYEQRPSFLYEANLGDLRENKFDFGEHDNPRKPSQGNALISPRSQKYMKNKLNNNPLKSSKSPDKKLFQSPPEQDSPNSDQSVLGKSLIKRVDTLRLKQEKKDDEIGKYHHQMKSETARMSSRLYFGEEPPPLAKLDRLDMSPICKTTSATPMIFGSRAGSFPNLFSNLNFKSAVEYDEIMSERDKMGSPSFWSTATNSYAGLKRKKLINNILKISQEAFRTSANSESPNKNFKPINSKAKRKCREKTLISPRTVKMEVGYLAGLPVKLPSSATK